MNMHEEFEDTKGVIRIRKSKKDRQHNGQKKKEKQRPTKHTHKTNLSFTFERPIKFKILKYIDQSHNSIGVYLILIPKDLVSSSLIGQLKI